MDCRAPQPCSAVMKCPGPSSPKIVNSKNCSSVPGMALDGRDRILRWLEFIINNWSLEVDRLGMFTDLSAI